MKFGGWKNGIVKSTLRHDIIVYRMFDSIQIPPPKKEIIIKHGGRKENPCLKSKNENDLFRSFGVLKYIIGVP